MGENTKRRRSRTKQGSEGKLIKYTEGEGDEDAPGEGKDL